jgi:hypothetical protein
MLSAWPGTHMNRTLLVAIFLLCSTLSFAQTHRWTAVKANDWYKKQPWLVGSNYIPASASNELEMWQAETFDPQQIDKELGWARSLGMNTMRVFLHDLVWQQDEQGFYQRMDAFLTLADKHHIRPIFVLFDSCWDPLPKLGPQRPPTPGVHNSAWVQSPGAAALGDPKQYPRLESYVRGVVGKFANDPRVLAWDVWNEPSNTNTDAYGKDELKNKRKYVLALLPQAFAWARSGNPTQPLTSGVWEGNWSSTVRMDLIARVQIRESDIISFHNYSNPADFEKHVRWLQRYKRPIICTEYMARSEGSRFDTILPVAKKLHVAAINWGLVLGKTQTNLPWSSWKKPYVDSQPPEWFHDVFYPDGRPYKDSEARGIRELTGTESAQEKEPK